MNLLEWDTYFRDIFDFSLPDRSLNGIQVHSDVREIKNLAFSVDCTLSTLEKMFNKDYQLLVVHHGLFWGESEAITGPLYKKLSFFLSQNLALYALHLPLDTHSTLGNNAQLAGVLGLDSPVQNLEYKNSALGFTGRINKAELVEKLEKNFPETFAPQHRSMIEKIAKNSLLVGVSSGAFSSSLWKSLLKSCAQIDVLITGETDLGTFNAAQDMQLPIVPLGHYCTETLGLQALQRKIKKEYPTLNCDFIGDDKFI